jgi:UDP-glucose 4-epimerase
MKETADPAGSRRPAALDPTERVVAITGACGFVGAELIKRLEEDRRYYKVLAIDIRKPTFPLSKTQFHRVDLTLPGADAELAALLEREGVDTFVHAAFLSNPTHQAAWAHELENIGTIAVLNACAERRIARFVMWSMTACYGARATNPNFLSETAELRAHPGSRSIRDRIEAEKEVQRFRREHADTDVAVLRTANILGPRVRNFVARFFSRPVAPALMGYDPLMQFVHEEDAIDAFKLVVDGRRDDPARGFDGAYNIVGEGVLPYTTVLAMLGRIPLPVPHFVAAPLSRLMWLTQVFDSPPSFLQFLRFLCVADGEKARRELGFVPQSDIKQTVLDFLGVGPQAEEFAAAGRT